MTCRHGGPSELYNRGFFIAQELALPEQPKIRVTSD